MPRMIAPTSRSRAVPLRSSAIPVAAVVVPGDLAAARLAACHLCPDHRPATGKCHRLGCGCVVQDWVKRPWAKCPAERWNS